MPQGTGQILLLLFTVAAADGCATRQGRLTDLGTYESIAGSGGAVQYRVAADGGRVLSERWLLDNFFTDPGGKLTAKDTPDYMTRFDLDLDGDGHSEVTKAAPLYDLRYKHKQRDAVIWLRTFPVSADLGEKDLRVLVQRYVDEGAGAGYEAVRRDEKRSILVERRFAAEIIEHGDASIAWMDAHWAVVDVANVDQIALSPGRRTTRVKLVLIRAPFRYLVDRGAREPASLPVVMLAGYANLPEDFATDLPAFETFITRIEFPGGKYARTEASRADDLGGCARLASGKDWSLSGKASAAARCNQVLESAPKSEFAKCMQRFAKDRLLADTCLGLLAEAP